MKRIIHIATDEKFINSAYSQFKQINDVENIFYILVDDVNDKLNHVIIQEGICLISNDVQTLRNLGKNINKSDLICSHGMSYNNSIVVNSLPKTIKLLWILYGTEIYNNSFLFNKKIVTGTITYKTFFNGNTIDKLQKKFKSVFRGFKYRINHNTLVPHKEVLIAMQRAEYCGILYKEEFNLVKSKLHTDIKHFKFTYYPIEKMLEDINVNVNESNILLGNSASFTNNHLEVFEKIKNLDLKDSKIITPLSYGNRAYAENIIQHGTNSLGKNFEPLTDFMPLHEYNTYIQSCGIVIMNHYRQQAVGNVLTMLWMGAKVYLDDRNTLYHYLKRIGVHVFEIKTDLISENENALKLLTKEEQSHNRACLEKEISQEFIFNELERSVNSIVCH